MKPTLRFQGFHDEWEEKKLGEVAEIKAGKDLDKNKLIDKGFPVFGNALNDKGLLGFYSDYEFVNDAVTVTGRGDIGKAFYRKGKFNTVGRLISVCSNQNPYFFAEAINRIKIFNESTGVPQLTALQLKEYKTFLPSLSEQEKIGEFLSQLDNRIEKQEQKIALLKERKKGWMQKIFNQEIRFKDENGNDYPDWEEKKLGDIAKISRGLTYKPKDICDSGIRVLRSSNILENHFIILDDIFVDDKSVSINLINKNDIIITAANGSLSLVGKHAIINSVNEKMVHGGFMLKCESPSNLFINQWMNTDEYNRQICQSIQGGNGALGNISKAQLELFTINFPSFLEQEKIANFLSVQDELIEKEEEKLNCLKEQKKGLLQQIFV